MRERQRDRERGREGARERQRESETEREYQKRLKKSHCGVRAELFDDIGKTNVTIGFNLLRQI